MSGATAVRTEQIRVAFSGEGSGEADLTWGQREIWESIALAGRSIAMGGFMPLPPGTTVAEAVAVLRFSMSRHPALRTRFRCDETGRPVRQVLHAGGEIMLEVFDVDEGQDPAGFAAELRVRYEDATFDYANEWPLRMGVVRHRGAVTHAVVMYCHLIIDGYGLDALSRDLANLDRGTGQELAPTIGMSPLAQAAQQASTEGIRRTEGAMRYWQRLLRTIPAKRFAGSDDPRTPRYWQVGLTSPAMALALRVVSERTQLDSSPVLLGAFAVSLAGVTGINPVAIRVVVSNRFRAGFAESVSVVNQTGLCVVDVAGATFDEVAVRAWRSSIGAGMHAYYDPVRLKELVARESRERGEELDIACFFNDTRREREHPPATAVTGRDILDRLPDTTVEWMYQQDQPNERMFLNISDPPDTVEPDAIRVALCADTHHVSPADLEACARGMQDVLVAAATDHSGQLAWARSSR